jgi:trimeric autotransporter adhesin
MQAAVLLLACAVGPLAACSDGGPGSPEGSVASVTISPDTLRLLVGTEGRLGATMRDSIGTTIRGPSVFWSSADTTVATIDQDGLVRGVRVGAARISANVAGRSDLADVLVRSAGAAAVTVDPPAASVLVGGTTQLAATVRDADGVVMTDRPVVWSSENSAVATVSQQGVVTGVNPGTTNIVASREGKTGSSAVTVARIPVAQVVVSPAQTEVKINKTVKLTATTLDAQGKVLTGRQVTWTSSNTARATVDQNGIVTGRFVGVVTITATSEGVSRTATVTVKT